VLGRWIQSLARLAPTVSTMLRSLSSRTMLRSLSWVRPKASAQRTPTRVAALERESKCQSLSRDHRMSLCRRLEQVCACGQRLTLLERERLRLSRTSNKCVPVVVTSDAAPSTSRHIAHSSAIASMYYTHDMSRTSYTQPRGIEHTHTHL
jgi:hypothetical protein